MTNKIKVKDQFIILNNMKPINKLKGPIVQFAQISIFDPYIYGMKGVFLFLKLL
jgi:hypothetical protein